MAKERKIIGRDHHNNPVHEGRKVVGKDHYGREVFDGQVAIKDAHGNKVFQEPHVGTGAAHIHGGAGRVDTGRTDAHGLRIHADIKGDAAEE